MLFLFNSMFVYIVIRALHIMKWECPISREAVIVITYAQRSCKRYQQKININIIVDYMEKYLLL